MFSRVPCVKAQISRARREKHPYKIPEAWRLLMTGVGVVVVEGRYIEGDNS